MPMMIDTFSIPSPVTSGWAKVGGRLFSPWNECTCTKKARHVYNTRLVFQFRRKKGDAYHRERRINGEKEDKCRRWDAHRLFATSDKVYGFFHSAKSAPGISIQLINWKELERDIVQGRLTSLSLKVKFEMVKTASLSPAIIRYTGSS